jgi:hypothetical protein
MPWFWDQIEAKDMYHHYRPVAAFVADIPWTTANMKRAAIAVSPEQLRAVGLTGDSGAWVWVSNSEATWYRIGVEDKKPEPVADGKLTIPGLPAGTYRVEWWDTWKGEAIGQSEVRSTGDALQLALPEFARDIACKVTRAVE